MGSQYHWGVGIIKVHIHVMYRVYDAERGNMG